MKVSDLSEAKKLVSLIGQVIEISGDIAMDGKIDWADILHASDLVPIVKSLLAIDYSMTAAEFAALTEAEKDELVYYFDAEFKMKLPLGEAVVEEVFEALLDLYMGLKVALGVIGRFKARAFA